MKTIQTTINGIPVLLVDFGTIKYPRVSFFEYEGSIRLFEAKEVREIILPPPPTGYTWRFINLTKDLTEEQAAELVNNVGAWDNLYENYQEQEPYFDTALESFVSFLQKHGIEDGSIWGLIVGVKV